MFQDPGRMVPSLMARVKGLDDVPTVIQALCCNGLLVISGLRDRQITRSHLLRCLRWEGLDKDIVKGPRLMHPHLLLLD